MRKLAVLAVMVMMIMAIAAPVSARAPAKADKAEKTWVCHVTNSEKNKVVLVHVAKGWDNGHGDMKPGGKNSARHQDYDSVYEGATDATKAGPTAATDCTPPCESPGCNGEPV